MSTEPMILHSPDHCGLFTVDMTDYCDLSISSSLLWPVYLAQMSLLVSKKKAAP